MNEDDRIAAAASRRENSSSSLPPLESHAASDFRILELEIENSRLQRLVAELLLKNQQLRRAEE
jgi:hypothetical protein